jgi:hypothetical protein
MRHLTRKRKLEAIQASKLHRLARVDANDAERGAVPGATATTSSLPQNEQRRAASVVN